MSMSMGGSLSLLKNLHVTWVSSAFLVVRSFNQMMQHLGITEQSDKKGFGVRITIMSFQMLILSLGFNYKRKFYKPEKCARHNRINGYHCGSEIGKLGKNVWKLEYIISKLTTRWHSKLGKNVWKLEYIISKLTTREIPR